MSGDFDYSWDDQHPEQIQGSLEFGGPDDWQIEQIGNNEQCNCGNECNLNTDFTCGCERCFECDECLIACECDRCDYCRELTDLCTCDYCESCHDNTFDCDCLKCTRCKELPDNCSCEDCDCPVCRLTHSVRESSEHPEKEDIRAAVFSRVGALWTKEEDEFIAQQYLDKRAVSQIASETSRTDSAILARLNSLCFPAHEKDIEPMFDYVHRPWTKFETEAVQATYENGAKLANLANQMNRPLWEVRNYLIESFTAMPIGLAGMLYGSEKANASSSRRWTPENLALLTSMLAASASIEDIADSLERSVAAVISKLLSRHLIDEVDIDLAIRQASSRYNRLNGKDTAF
jgi:hypothetical protein